MVSNISDFYSTGLLAMYNALVECSSISAIIRTLRVVEWSLVCIKTSSDATAVHPAPPSLSISPQC